VDEGEDEGNAVEDVVDVNVDDEDIIEDEDVVIASGVGDGVTAGMLQLSML